MKNSDPILPIRREVGNSSFLKNLAGSKKQESPTNERTLRFENLEERRVLSATGLVPDTTLDNSAYVTSVDQNDFGFQQDEAISSLTVLVNGDERQLTHADNVLTLLAGDTLEVTEIAFNTDADEGVFAAEGYVNKVGDLTSASLIDYNDGRFSDPSRDFAANGGDGAVAGLNNSWTVEAGWDRLTLNLIHYTEAATDVSGRFFVNLQVGEPDFAFDTEVLDRVTQQDIVAGDAVVIPGGWFNSSSGVFHNYAEVNVYQDSNPDAVVWAGALVGNAGDSVEGEFVNTRANDPFSERWTPTAPGEYTLRYYIDPENSAAESNEDNNFYEIRLTVRGDAQPTVDASAASLVVVDDVVEAGDLASIDVLENDVVQTYQEDFESSETLGWTTNPNGTDTATTGVWQAITPEGTAWNGVQLQLEASEGNGALVTGGEDDGSIGFNDVDGGVTSAVSELLAVPAEGESTLSFDYSFAHLHNSSSEDFFRVSVVGENQTEVVLEERGDSVDRAGQWTEFSADLTSYAVQNVQLLVEAGDLGNTSLVEAGIDNVQVTSEVPLEVNDFAQAQNGRVELNEDGTFSYTADPGFSGQDSFRYNVTDGESVSDTALVTVNVESDFAELGIMAETSGDFPVDAEFFGIREADGQTITISGLPKFVQLSEGTFDGQNWTLSVDDLDGLEIKSSTASDTEGWSSYDAYDYKNWDVNFSVTDSDNNVVNQGVFQFATWQQAATVEVAVGDRTGFEFQSLNDFYSPERNSGGFIVTYQFTVTEDTFAADSSQVFTIDGGYTGDGRITNVFVNSFNGLTNSSSDGSFDIGNTEVGFRPDLRVGDTFTVSFQIDGAGYSPDDFDLVLVEVTE